MTENLTGFYEKNCLTIFRMWQLILNFRNILRKFVTPYTFLQPHDIGYYWFSLLKERIQRIMVDWHYLGTKPSNIYITFVSKMRRSTEV